MGKFIDITGQRFGKLVAINRTNNTGNNGNIKWIFKCDCGNIIETLSQSVRNGLTKSCGCISKKHNKTKTRLYNIWVDMRQRCKNPNGTKSHLWYGKNIKVCKEWNENFINFYNWAIENGYNDKLSIDRIDNNLDYCPENCRWATYKQQANNTIKTKHIVIDGIDKTLSEWIEISPITKSTYYKRKNSGMNDYDALFKGNSSKNKKLKSMWGEQ